MKAPSPLAQCVVLGTDESSAHVITHAKTIYGTFLSGKNTLVIFPAPQFAFYKIL